MPTLEEALQIILAKVSAPGVERVELQSALGRVLAKDVTAPWPMPQYNTSARDGFAVRSSDCLRGETTLRVTGFIPAGGEASAPVVGGSAVRVMTGAPVPHNSDAVVAIEDTVVTDQEVTILAPVRPRQHIRYKGEDIATGDTVLAAGTVIQSQEIGVLASIGKAVVPVYQKVQVAVLCTGDELIELGDQPSPGRIVNSNAHYLAAALREIGAEPVILCIARDQKESLKELISTGLKADALITSAGVSAGDRDFVKDVLAELGVRQMLWKVDIKPGGPKAFGMKGGTPVFSLPGNPASTMITFEEFVRPALLRMMGHQRVIRPYLKAVLRDETRKKAGRVHCLSVRVEMEDGRYVARNVGEHRACKVRTMLTANAIAMLPKDPAVVPAGTEVEVHLLRGDLGLLQELESGGCVVEELRIPGEKEPFTGKIRMVKSEGKVAAA